MTELEKAARQALEIMHYLEALNSDTQRQKMEAITALRRALEQQPAEEPLGYWNAVEGWVELPEDEEKPAAWVHPEFWQHLESVNCGTAYRLPGENRQPLYTRPQPAAQFAGSYGTIDESAAKRIATALGWEPKREWIALTQQDIDIAFDDTQEGGGFDDFAHAIEQRLKEKNT